MLTETLLRIPLSVIGQCSPVSAPHWLQGKASKFSCHMAAFNIILQDHRRLPVCIFRIKIVALGSFTF
jgi:hypothetical protein